MDNEFQFILAKVGWDDLENRFGHAVSLAERQSRAESGMGPNLTVLLLGFTIPATFRLADHWMREQPVGRFSTCEPTAADGPFLPPTPRAPDR